MLISGLNKTTLLDYPGRVAATVFTGGCNFRCPFCHNGGLVLSPLTQEHYTEEDILGFLKKRKHILSGVCITGGEPTIQQDLPDFIYKIKELGLAVKLDTNGSHPHMLEELIGSRLIMWQWTSRMYPGNIRRQRDLQKKERMQKHLIWLFL